MAIIKSYSTFLNLSNFQVFENDDLPTSAYFRISDLSETLTGGKNGFLIEGSEHLKESTEIKIEILDVEGNPVYFEPGDGSPEYYEGNSKLIAVHVYEDTPIGIGKITILGELKSIVGEDGAIESIPSEWVGAYNVKWEKTIQINKNVSNEDIVRFYKKPIVNVSELVKPIFTKNIPSVVQSGSLQGISQNPPSGTDLSKWRAGTVYKLKIDDGISNWTSSVDDNIINISSLNYSPNVIEVLSNTEVLVDTPFTSSGNLVNDFGTSNYQTTFEFIEGQTITDSALTGSFAKINFNNLKTFVGDVARVKVFRKSRNTIGDFQFVQESKLESSELLKDITTTADTELSYGRFDDTNLSTYWITSSNDHPVTINTDILNASVKIDYDESEGGIQTLSTSGSFEISSGVEYTLNLKTLLSGSEGTSQSIRAYFSGSNYEQNFLSISGSSIYKTRQSVSQNILATTTANDTYLKFDIDGGDWYISNISLKNAQDTSFSPDEFTLIQDIPRKLASETFDFKFEFYDINNNYIPVDVTTTKAFNGGNDFPSSDKLMTFESDRNAFRFSSGSIGSPPFQQIQFKTATNNLTGSITFASSAFDVDGIYINPSSYTGEYPGRLTNPTNAGAIISIANFSGSDDSITVGSIVYTASIEELEEFETVYRLEDGDNAPQLIVTSNANQFIYEPTTLSPKPSGQSITVRAQRKNLTSLTTPIEVNSGSNTPPLSVPITDNSTGIDTYTISALEFSSSFASNNFDEVTYSFTGSDQFGIDFSDEITLSKVISFDAVSLVLSNESTSFPAKSTGEVTSDFNSSKGNVQMFIGGTQITHDDIGGGRVKNTFDITSVSGTNVTPDSSSPTINEYGISAFENSKDSGSLNLNIEYLAGDNSISQSFQKVVSYTKSKKGQPTVSVQATPVAQTVAANSAGTMTGDIQDITITLFEGGTEMNYNQNATLANSDYKITNVTHNQGSVSDVTITDTTPNANVIEVSSVASTVTNAILTATISYRDSEGTLGTQTVKFNIAKLSEATAGLIVEAEPQTQTVNSNADFSSVATPSPVLIHVYEDGTPLPYDSSSPYTHGSFYINNTTGGTLTKVEGATSASVQPTTPSSSTSINGFVSVVITDSSGQTTLSRKKNFSVAVSVTGDTGIDAVSVTPSISNQNIVRTNTGTFANPTDIAITVIQGATTFTYDDSSPYAVSTFYIDNIANCTNNDDGTITPDTPSSITPVTSTYDVTYKDSEGVSKTQSFTHVTTVTLDGNTGPGIVHTGLWEASRAYQFDNGNSGNPGVARRDSVLYSGTYYAATAQHTSTATGTTGPPGVGSNWESLGSQDLFVAAKIAIFEESYVQNTLNVGTNDNGGVSTANITLHGGSANPYFSLGQATQGVYGAAGIFIGSFDNSGTNNYRQSLVNSDGSKYLKWDGSNLEIAGSITITGGNAATTTDSDNAALSASLAQSTADGINSNTGSLINPASYSFGSVLPLASGAAATGLNLTSQYLGYHDGTDWKSYMGSDGGFYLGGDSGALQWDGSTLAIEGNVVITGGATSQSLHDAIADAAAAQQTADDIVPGDANPSSYAFGNTNSGTRFALAASTAQQGLNLNSSNLGYYSTGSSSWKTYMASNGDFFLSGPAGTGGLSWNSGTGALVVNGSGTFTGALAGGTISCPTSNPKFTVTAAGAMTATDATISGDITATTGVIGGWTVGSSQLYSPSNSTSNRLTLNAGGAPSLSINNSSGGVATEINSNATLSTGFGSTPSLTATSLAKSPTTPTSVNLTAGVNLYSRVNGQTSSGGAPTSAVSWVDLTNYVTISGLANGSCTIQATQDVANTYADSVHSVSSYGGAGQFTSVSGIVEFGFVVQTGVPSSGIGSGVVGYHTKTLLDGVYSSGNQFYFPYSYGASNNVGQISFIASSNTNYYLIPYVKREQYTVNYPAAFTSRLITFKTATAPTTSISASQPVSRTEICAGGLQVVSTSSNYVKMQRNTAASGAGSVMLSVGGSIEATGNITANASDKRLKDIKGLITNPLSKLKQLNGVIYNWNNLAKNLAGYDSSIDNVGLIAQDVQKVLPEAVARAPFDTEKDEQGRVVSSKSGKDYLTIWYERLVPLLVEGVKELTERVDKLEEENKKLKE